MRLTTPAIILTLRAHGEHGAVVRLMTPGQGLVAAYVRGARGRRMRPVLLARSRAPLMTEPLPAAAIAWVSALTAQVLPEHQAYPALYEGLDGLLEAIGAAPSASGWGPALLAYELLILAELGFGLEPELVARAASDWLPGLALTGRRIRRDLLERPGEPAWDARERLTHRLRRAAGLVA